MPIKIGTQGIGDLNIGTGGIDKVYVGSQLVYSTDPTPPFNPGDLSGMVAWWGDIVNDGVDRTTLADGTEITQWDDISGNDYHWTSTSAPTVYDTSTDSLDFYGTRLGYTNAVPLTNDGTIFYLATPSSNSATYQIQTSPANRLALISEFTAGLSWETFHARSWGYRSSFGSNLTGFNLLTMPYKANTDEHLRRNGTELSSLTNAKPAYIEDENAIWVKLGSSTGGNIANFNIQEFIYYNRLLTSTEIDQVENWLNTKYSIY